MNELYAQIFSRKFVSALSAHRTGNSCTCTDLHLHSCSNLDLLPTDTSEVVTETSEVVHSLTEALRDRHATTIV